MRPQTLRRSALVLIGLIGVALIVHGVAGNRDALRHIVQDKCLQNWQAHHEPAPCREVQLGSKDDRERGYAVLADRKGGAHLLLIPTRTILGIEDPYLVSAGAPNYFAAAWNARDWIARAAKVPLQDTDVGLAINSKYSRSQDELHIHMECIRPAVHNLLVQRATELSDAWLPIDINGARYFAIRIPGEELAIHNPFVILTRTPPAPEAAVATYTLILTRIKFTDVEGFVLLAGHDVPGGETLLDPRCEIARRPAGRS